MTPADALMAQELRALADKARALADGIEAGKLWPGELQDGLRAISEGTRKMDRAVADARPRPSRGGRW